MSLAAMIPNYNAEVDRLLQYGPSGFVLAFNLTFRGPEHLHSAYPEEWVKIYQDKNYFILDPINFWTFSHIGEKRWSEIKLPDMDRKSTRLNSSHRNTSRMPSSA